MPSAVASETSRQAATFTLAALPDTQYYVANRPEIFEAQTSWIVREHTARAIGLVVHEGDIVDSDTDSQWTRASRALHALDGVVPYVLSAGNHDYERRGDHVTRNTLMNAYFPSSIQEAFQASGTFEAGRLENSWQIVSFTGGQWLVVSLEFGPRGAVLAWADEVVKRFPTTPTIVVTHAYLAADDTRYDHVRRPGQLWNPYRYLDSSHAGMVNDGEEIWDKLIVQNDNIAFVLCGHELGDGAGRLTSIRPDGTMVQQILANYQMDAAGGGGYLRLMQFAPLERAVRVSTFSPFLNLSKTDASNDFTLTY